MTVEVTTQIEVAALVSKTIDTFRGVIEHVDDGMASVCLYDPTNDPVAVVRMSRDELEEQGVPFDRGVLFDFEVRRIGSAEEFIMNYIPPAKLTPEEAAEDDAQIADVTGGE